MDESIKKTGKFLLISCVAALSFALLFLSVNYFSDRYYVFHPQDGVFEEILEPNTRVLKARYLAQHCREFNAVIMGSSRDIAYNTDDINRVFDVRAYNFGVASGNLRGILARLEWLARMECLPGRIFISISIDRLRLPDNVNDLLRKEYPGIVEEESYNREFILSYIGTDAFISNIRKMIRRLRKGGEPKFRYDMRSGDVQYLWDRDFPIAACAAEQVNTDSGSIRLFAGFLVAIQSLARNHQSEITLIWNPLPRPDQLAHLEDTKLLFGQMTGEFDQIYRLPLSDARLQDDDYYLDEGHFKPELGAALIESPAHRVPLGQLLQEMESAWSGDQTSCSSQ